MAIIDDNRKILANLYESFPESLNGLNLDGNNLVNGTEQVDISGFNLNDLIYGENQAFVSSLGELKPEDVFKIIRVHALLMNSKKKKYEENGKNELEVIKEENPLLKNINIVTRKRNNFIDEYINIVDSAGVDHMFKNEMHLNIKDLIDVLKIRLGSTQLTPEELIYELNHKMKNVALDASINILDGEEYSESFRNKIKRVNRPYEGRKEIKVYGNEKEDIALVANPDDLSKHDIITFNTNQYGDLELVTNEQNVKGTDTKQMEESSNFESDSTSEVVSEESEVEVEDTEDKDITARMIPWEVFVQYVNSTVTLTEEQRKDLDLFYGCLGDLVLYEDYLMQELKDILNLYRKLVLELQSLKDGGLELTDYQQEAVNKNTEFEEQKINSSAELTEQNAMLKGVAYTKKMDTRPRNTEDNTGSISTIQVIAIIIGVSIILTAITLYLIG